MSLVLKFFVLGFSALLPVINPLGSALILLGVVGAAPAEVFRNLARRIAINTVLFLLTIELVGAAVLTFFGISLPVVQLAGGFVLAGMGWGLLNNQGDGQSTKQSAADASGGTLADKVFYPLTFPVTAGPGCIVVMLTLSAHATAKTLGGNLLARAGLLLAAVALSWLVYLCYAYAPQITRTIAPSTV